MLDFIIGVLVLFGIGMGIRALIRRQKRSVAPPPPTSLSPTPPPVSAPPSRTNFCPQCGTSVGADATFCGNCGAKLQ